LRIYLQPALPEVFVMYDGQQPNNG
jgi:hypothetical protein